MLTVAKAVLAYFYHSRSSRTFSCGCIWNHYLRQEARLVVFQVSTHGNREPGNANTHFYRRCYSHPVAGAQIAWSTQ